MKIKLILLQILIFEKEKPKQKNPQTLNKQKTPKALHKKKQQQKYKKQKQNKNKKHKKKDRTSCIEVWCTCVHVYTCIHVICTYIASSGTSPKFVDLKPLTPSHVRAMLRRIQRGRGACTTYPS